MDQAVPILLFVLVAIFFVAFGIYSWKKEQARIRAIEGFAARNSLRFLNGRDRGLSQTFSFLPDLNTGSNRYAQLTLSGMLGGRETLAFEHHYETHSTDSKGRRSTTHHYHCVYAVIMERSFPGVTILPEGVFSKIAQAFGYDDIDFESAEFSKAFCVRSPDRKFAFDFCNPRMIEFLLARRSIRMAIEGRYLAVVHGGRHDPNLLEHRFHEVLKLRDLMPEYLFTA